MNRGNDVTEAMLGDGDVVESVQGASISSQGDVSPAPQQSTPTQLTQNPLQHFMVTGQVQVQNVTLASPQQVTAQRPGQPQQLLAGMMVVPQLSPSPGFQQVVSHPSTMAGSAQGTTALLLTHSQDARELQIARSTPTQTATQIQLAATFPATSTVSASGGTIHHHGQSPTRGTIPPLANPAQHQTTSQHNLMASVNLQQQLTATAGTSPTTPGLLTPPQPLTPTPVTPQGQTTIRRMSASGSLSPGANTQRPSFERTSPLLSYGPLTISNRTSPIQSPDRVRKRIKLEAVEPPTLEIGNKRKLICDEKLRQMREIKENYNEHLTELFFLQNGGNIMDYYTWKKRPTVQLLHFLKSGNLDSDEEEEPVGTETMINDEVKVITTSGGTTPLATPVAISTTLPPAITAMQQQGSSEPGKKLGGRHGMVFGHVQPSAVQQMTSPQMPGRGGVPLISSPPTTPSVTQSVASVTTPTAASALSSPAVPPPPYTGVAPSTATPTTPVLTVTKSTTVTTTTSVTSASTTASLAPNLTSQLAKVMAETPTPIPATPPVSKAVVPTTTTTTTPSSTASGGLPSVKSPSRPGLATGSRFATRQHSISAVYDIPIGSQEAIVERAKQEAQVMQRVAELRKEGLWSARRLPKVQEPLRNKAHWDYLLEEMQWLAADFAQERKWKKAGARKIARMIMRYFQEQQQKELRAEKEEANRTRRIASNMAKMVKEFWSNIEKVVQYKQQSRLEEKRKKALDLHLSFIVDQTEKYSSWLTEGLAGPPGSSIASSSLPASPAHSRHHDDGDFEPDRSESDDEETIAKAEKELGLDEIEQRAELDDLERESTMPLDELLRSLPKEILEKPASLEASEQGSGEDNDTEKHGKDEEFCASDESDEDMEDTIAEQEQKERRTNHKQELADLEAESELSMEELYKKYAAAYDEEFEAQLSEPSTDYDEEESDLDSDDEEEEEEEEEDESSEEEETDGGGDGEEIGMEFLLNAATEQKPDGANNLQKDEKGPSKDITDIAATALSLQPTGYTLETTQVITPVPFLLKHTLREYQHVGLDWLATMHDRKLNGILADEMGLGKTIQTIALLAHLACEKEVWGPHLIVVPTSVMLNWEMEFKKWCPAFKILTYYGNQKERKQKRTGWTKTNAFHVCITSYKLVIQDHQAFRRKKWKYFILDEAQNIKNFKSQRWQTLLNFSSQRRLLLTGTPLQNSLMELWSLMHFLMPHVFASHREFKEWFSNPLSGMIEGSREYNENLIKRLHKVLRPFLLRRLKVDVEKQMPKKYEHVVMCRLSKRQRFLYDDFMAQAKTKETLASGHFMSVINILMQLRKVCNHPNLFDPRPILTSLQQEGITYTTASLVLRALEKDPLSYLGPTDLQPCLAGLELVLPAFAAHRIRKLQTSKPLIEEIDNLPDPPTRPKPLDKPNRLLLSRSQSPLPQVSSGRSSPVAINAQSTSSPLSIIRTTPASTIPSSTSPIVKATTVQATQASSVLSRAVLPTGAVAPLHVVSSAPSQVVATPAAVTTTQLVQLPGHTPTTASIAQAVMNAQQAQTTLVTQAGGSGGGGVSSSTQQMVTSQPITVQIHHTQQGTRLMIPSGQLSQLPAGFIQIVQTASGQQIIATTQPSPAGQQVQQVAPLARVTVAQPVINGPVANSVVATVSGSLPATTQLVMSQARTSSTTLSLPSSPSTIIAGKPVVRVSPLAQSSTLHASTVSTTTGLSLHQHVQHSSTAASSPTTAVSWTSSPRTATVKPSVVTRMVTTATTKLKQKSPFFMESIEAKRVKCRREKLARLAWNNRCNCEVKPVYGQDLCQAVNIYTDPVRDCDNWRRKGLGLVHCYRVHQSHRTNRIETFWSQTHALSQAVHTPQSYLTELRDILNRFVFVVPPVTAPRIQLHTSHPPPSLLNKSRMLVHQLHRQLSPLAVSLHPMHTDMTVQCPEARLIQYDCGKLQTMDSLLRKLKTGGHRALIFTQMTKMLDVLEAFLNYHGHRYLRLDGTTRVEQRQALMERFNMDRRIFCFILSTRSGGIGVNLTGADTVIFYDSDWNPTMDAQAQDRCHRIGQTRDVHIYRLISERTVEENILKKANQKRLLGNVAIEGGNFTTAFFKENTLKDLFAEPSGLNQLAREKEVQAAAAAAQADRDRETAKAITQEQIEQALCNAEDETDVQAAKVVAAEQKAELAEFDENIPWDEKEEASRREEDDISKVEQELAMLEKELTSVERYAVNFVEAQMSPFTSEELQKAEEEVVLAKEEWELTRLKALREEEERRAELEEDEMLFTYSRQEAYNQVYICDETGEQLPIWSPPTPPQDDNDVYIDQTICFLYEPTIMPESQLPPVYIKKEHKRLRVEVHAGRKHKVRKEDQPRAPRSLFDRPSAAMRRDAKLGKLIRPVKPQVSSVSRPHLDTAHDQPEWLIHEDWALLQAVQMLLELPLNLTTSSPAHIPNWDLVADVVNSQSRTYRSPKQCKNRYENVIVPREEGKILYDINPRKQKKSKGIYKTKNNRPMRTSQLFLQDNSGSVTTLYTMRFDSTKCITTKRTPTLRPTLVNPTLKNPKHAAVLAESGISYDAPLTPIEVATIRADRIAKEKKQAAAAAQEQQQAQQSTTALQQVTTATTVAAAAATPGATASPAVTAAVVAATTGQPQMTIVQGSQLQPVVSGATTAVLQKAVTAVSLARTLGTPGSIVVNTPGGVSGTQTFATINKRVSQAGTPIQVTTATVPGALTQQTVRGRTTTAPMTVQEITAAVANQPQRLATGVTGTTAQVITTTTLTPAQLVATQRGGTVTATSVTPGTVQQALTTTPRNTLTTHQQIQYLRQQTALLKQRQQLRHQGRIPAIQAEQLKQQQLKRLQAQAVQQAVQQAVPAAATTTVSLTTMQKTVTAATPLITSVAQPQVTQARLQAPKQGMKRSLTEAEMTTLLRRHQLQQQKVLASGQAAAGSQLTATQLMAGTQVVGQGTSTSQPVATLVKTVSSPGSTVPSVTIPVSAMSLGNVNISVTVPQQKAGQGKVATPQQQRQFHQLQLQRKVPLGQQTQQKVPTLTASQIQQVTKAQLTAPLIIQQQQQQKLPVTMQQFQQIVKQQAQAQQQAAAAQQAAHVQQAAPTIQQIITSVPPATTAATVIATQLLTQAQSAQSVTKVSVPMSQHARSTAPVTVTAIPTSNPVTVVSHGIPVMTSQASVTMTTATVTLTPNQTTLVKQVQEAVASPSKALPVSTATIAQLKAVQQQVAGVRPAAVAGQTVHVTQVPSVQQALKAPSMAVQQAVQQVQAQAQQQRQQAAAAAAAAAQAGGVTVTTVPPATTIMQVTPGQVVQSVTQAGTIPQDQKSPPYAMRLRKH